MGNLFLFIDVVNFVHYSLYTTKDGLTTRNERRVNNKHYTTIEVCNALLISLTAKMFYQLPSEHSIQNIFLFITLFHILNILSYCMKMG